VVDRQLRRVHESAPLSPGSLVKRSKKERKGGHRRHPGPVDGGQPSSPIIERLKGEDNSRAGQALATKLIPLSSVGRLQLIGPQ
jgi:hypothetical protein